MFRVTRQYAFAASHRLHSLELAEAENQRIFGKCNNPHGHGHNYVVEVSIQGPVDSATGRVADPVLLDQFVRRWVIGPLDHRNLNVEVNEFASKVPTSENLGYEICRRLKQNWKEVFPGEWPRSEKVRIGETPRNIF